ncbi:MAG: hypothetical protein WD032_00730 [Nitrospirales bacterium]
MIRTEQLSPDTIMFYVEGIFHQKIAQELSLAVFRSHRLGFKAFLFNLRHVSYWDNQGSHNLALIGQGLEEKGCTWRIIQAPLSAGDQLILPTSLQQIPPASWN